MTESEVLLSDPLALRDHEQRLFTCCQAAIDLLNPNEEAHNQARTRELLEFLFEEYEAARAELLATLCKEDS